MNEAAVSSAMLALIASGARAASDLVTVVISPNLAQALGVIQGNLIHQHGGVGDDPGLIAALQTAAGAPKQGAITGGGTP